MTSPPRPMPSQSCRLVVATIVLLSVSLAADSHPTGKSAICRYTRLSAGRDRLHIRYILEMAEIPTVGEKQTMDRDKNGKISEEEKAAYLAAKTPELMAGLTLAVNDRPRPLTSGKNAVTLSGGSAGLETLRIVIDLSAELPSGDAEFRVAYQDRNYEKRAGWKEVIAVAGNGVTLRDSSVPATDRSRELTKYPKDAIPPQVTEARFTMVREPSS